MPIVEEGFGIGEKKTRSCRGGDEWANRFLACLEAVSALMA